MEDTIGYMMWRIRAIAKRIESIMTILENNPIEKIRTTHEAQLRFYQRQLEKAQDEYENFNIIKTTE